MTIAPVGQRLGERRLGRRPRPRRPPRRRHASASGSAAAAAFALPRVAAGPARRRRRRRPSIGRLPARRSTRHRVRRRRRSSTSASSAPSRPAFALRGGLRGAASRRSSAARLGCGVFAAVASWQRGFVAGLLAAVVGDSSACRSAAVSFALLARVVVFVPEVTVRLSPADGCRAPPGRFRTLVRPLSSPRPAEEASQSRLTTGQIIYCLTLAAHSRRALPTRLMTTRGRAPGIPRSELSACRRRPWDGSRGSARARRRARRRSADRRCGSSASRACEPAM